MRVLVLSDTHLGAAHVPSFLEGIATQLDEADVILHAGDVTDQALLDALAGHAPVHAVRGNNDHTLTLPERLVVDIAGCRVAMVHDSGDAAGRGPRLHRWFPDADLVVFGHSHLPWNEADHRATDGHVQHHLNPGSPTQRRRAPRRTVAWVDLGGGAVRAVEHVAL